MIALALVMRPTDNGWAIYLTNGQQLVRYRGFASKQLALRYLQRYAGATSSAAVTQRPFAKYVVALRPVQRY